MSKPWTRNEEKWAAELRRDGLNCPEIAAELGRTAMALKNRLSKLGVLALRPWTKKEEAEAVRLRESGTKCQVIGRELGRSASAVKQRLQKLGVRRYRRKGWLKAAIRRRAHRAWYDWELADELGVTTCRIYQVRKSLGIPAGRFRGKGTKDVVLP